MTISLNIYYQGLEEFQPQVETKFCLTTSSQGQCLQKGILLNFVISFEMTFK